MADIFSAHPYNSFKQINPSKHHCDVCDRTLAYKDRAAHERSKKHKAELEKLKVKEAAANGWSATEGNENLDPNACHNCGQSGHMSKECPEPRKINGACFNCGQVGHNKSDCTNEAVVICKNCNGEGHMSRECPEPRSAANVTCNNCTELGHFARDCPKPRDYSRVTCNQCGHTGHTVRRCKTDPADYVVQSNAGFGEDAATAPSGNDDWMNNGTDGVAEPVAVEGGWMNTTDVAAAGEEWGATPTAAEW